MARKNKQTSEGQPVLVKPDERYAIERQGVIALELLEPTFEKVTSGFQQHIAESGVMEPIVIADPFKAGTNQPWQIVDGRRRVQAARNAQIAEVPFIKFVSLDGALIHVSTLALNDHREENILSEIHALENLQKVGLKDKEIAKGVNVPVGTIRRKLKLLLLHHELRMGLEDRKISGKVAVLIAPLSEAMQAALVAIYREKGELSPGDVSAVKNANKQKASKESLEGELNMDEPDLNPRQLVSARLVEALCVLRDEGGEELSGMVTDLLGNFRAGARHLLDQNGITTEQAESIAQAIKMFERELDLLDE